MNKVLNIGAFNVKIVEPKELSHMDDNQIVVVNRVRLNSKLVEWEIKNIDKKETIIIRKAIKLMKEKERIKKCAAMGAEMQVKDIRVIFPNYESLPHNSFAIVED